MPLRISEPSFLTAREAVKGWHSMHARGRARGLQLEPGKARAAMAQRTSSAAQCVICLEDPGEQRVRLECCASDFCCGCIETWVTSQNTCPHCRERVRRFARPGGKPDLVLAEDRDRAIAAEDEETRPDVLDPEHWISDAQVKCIGDSRCKWRSGEFDELSMSEQIELEGENCSIQCDQCTAWFHSFCVGFQSREALPSEDVDWLCPFCAGTLRPDAHQHRHRHQRQRQRQRPSAAAAAAAPAAPVAAAKEEDESAAQPAAAERRAAAAAAAERRAAAQFLADVASDSETDEAAAVVSSEKPKKKRRRAAAAQVDEEEEADSRQAAQAAAAVASE